MFILPTPLPIELIYLFVFLFGLIIGSFLNVLILRLPQKLYAEHAANCREEPIPPRWFGLEYLITPTSHCPDCQYRIKPWQNIPVLSWLLLRGRCANCSTKISIRYPIIEISSGLLALLVVWHFGISAQTAYALILCWGLLALSVIDIDEQLLPDELTQPLLWLGLLININSHFTPLSDAVIGAIAGYASLWLVFHVFLLLTGKEGMGFGDFKLFALLGAWLGWSMLPQILFISSVIGALLGVTLILLRQHDRQIPIPFGPFLALAGIVALLWGEQINQAYLNWTGI